MAVHGPCSSKRKSRAGHGPALNADVRRHRGSGEVDIQALTKDLESRIAGGKAWLESGKNLTLHGFSLRLYPTEAQLVEVLDTPGRVERHGLGFVVSVDTPRGLRQFRLNVRIKPAYSEGPKAESNPYVVTYVVLQTTGADDEIEHEHFSDPKRYAALAQLSIQDWYKNWIARSLESGSGKFFAPEVLLR